MDCIWRILDKFIDEKKAAEKLKLLDRKQINEPIPIDNIGIWSYVTIGWLSPLIMKLFRDRNREIREDDVWRCSEMEACDINTERSFPFPLGTRFRSGILGITYKKLLKLKNVNGKTASEVITIFGSDALRVLLNTEMFVYILSVPIYMIIGTTYLYHLIGIWCFTAFVSFLVMYALQACLIEVIACLRRRTLGWTDLRIQKTYEVLANMKLIKMYAWEEPFHNSIKDIRETESKPLMKSSILHSITGAVIPLTPSLATVVTIASYVYAGNGLTASTGFSIVATLTFMRNIVSFVPYASRIFGETLISFERIKRFMLEEEFNPPRRDVLESNNAVELRDTVFMWGNDNNNDPNINNDHRMSEQNIKDINGRETMTTSLVLRNINLTLARGKHIGICGTVGCGKSSLLQAMIGRMPLITGHLAVGGTVAYAAQQAWIFNATLRENILFGRAYQQEWYTTVLQACCLSPDISILPNGDMTEIGDRGLNLSGGQKQRVSLARAVYSKRDIYILDDPFSAVDVHVGQHLFHRCINDVLKNKTVVLVTHQLQYLKHCDEIYVMDEGEIAEHGTHDSLLYRSGHYKKLLEQFNMTHTNSTDDKTQAEDDMDSKLRTGNANRQQYSGTDNSEVNNGKGYNSVPIVTISGQMEIPPESNETRFSVDENATTFSLPTIINSTRVREDKSDYTDWYLTVYIYAAAGVTGMAVLKGIVIGMVVINASVNLHNKAIKRVMGTPMRYFDANPPGRILNRFSRDIEEADVFIPYMMDHLLQITIIVITSLATIAYNFPWILLPIIPVVFCVYIIQTISSVAIRNFKRLENVVRSPLLSHVTTSCIGLSTIVAYSEENDFINGCKQYSDRTTVGIFLYETCLKWIGQQMNMCGLVLSLTTTIVVLFTKDAISPAFAAMSLTMAINVASLTQFLSHALNDVDARFTSIERIHEYENLEIEKETGNLQVDKTWPSQGRITFSNVEMKYREDMDPTLKNISFDIIPKQKVGIVGRTGAGKSSLTAALFRLTDLSGGHVFIDDVEICSLSRKLLRSNLSSIPQDPVLFAGTIRYNLDPFDKYTDDQVWAALEQVHMKEKMNLLEQTLDFYVEESGENFSVGERQLICLARAILRQNKILVLDEATASIDTSTDAMIQKTIRDSFSDCTVLTIAHRLNTVLHCDVILVMDAGRVIEIGSPQTLLKSPSSHFNYMIRSQTALPTDA
ncbi:ATP-binding cassette sub-family C member 5-like [Ylistrum balloti]|uniref:ATP-binding cassette sub-family C member 5-like n=1 Tax=Ylistrum balloti TaxID=509963 RepID=UPI002905DF92|nr:ATP-binding cassette sub-family C member 5-like [Ylistrum balloti]